MSVPFRRPYRRTTALAVTALAGAAAAAVALAAGPADARPAAAGPARGEVRTAEDAVPGRYVVVFARAAGSSVRGAPAGDAGRRAAAA
ncbi:hypothetical protein ABZ891_32150, partial [Streptomyces sp. NPDC047023]|uniref:hypothetical protein n=1 Tax=Streptomyces sp. NPDC047023 TaxID=3155139 RepID=UPI003407F909